MPRVEKKSRIRVAAVGDLHCSRASRGSLAALFAAVAESADLLLLCGDLTDYGLPEEAHLLAQELKPVSRMPMAAVLGNHDFESGKERELKAILGQAGLRLLDGDSCELLGVGVAGVKGYIGGFGKRVLQSWGEPSLKRLVHEASEEALKLDAALARLRTAHRIVILHYAPIPATVEGEPLELYPFLGSGRLEEPLNRHPVTAVFHGHAHYGRAEGRTASGVPVFNVALPLLKRLKPQGPLFGLLELSADAR